MLASCVPVFAVADTLPPVNVGWTHPGPLLPDSSNFVTASLLVFSPGEAMYSQVGHVALRMECPVHDLDYCFSFEQETDMGGFVKFFSGKTDAHMMAVPTGQYLASARKDRRRVMQYTLALTTAEEQNLWRILDEDYVAPELRKFNFLQNNCSSVSLYAVEDVVTDETIDFNGWPEPFTMSNGRGVRFLTRNSAWLQFWCITFLGSESDAYWANEQRTSPELLPQVLKKASFVGADGARRPMVESERELLPVAAQFKPTAVTPGVVFGLLLLIVVLITLFQLKGRMKRAGQIVDVLLLTVVTVAGVVLLYTSFVSSLFGTHWNWYLIPCNPLPLLIWIGWHRKKNFYKIYWLYAAVLFLFVLGTPLSEQLDVEHQLFSLALLVRCVSAICEFKYKRKRIR